VEVSRVSFRRVVAVARTQRHRLGDRVPAHAAGADPAREGRRPRGAFGGAGGSSPFGSRAADQFVKITLWLAGVWVLVIMIHVKVVKYDVEADKNKSQTTATG
jgi:preprotein translocase subunit SecG